MCLSSSLCREYLWVVVDLMRCYRNILNECMFSFEEDAEARCKESLEKAVEVDAENAEAHHLLASYWLCKNDRQVTSIQYHCCIREYLWVVVVFLSLYMPLYSLLCACVSLPLSVCLYVSVCLSLSVKGIMRRGQGHRQGKMRVLRERKTWEKARIPWGGFCVGMLHTLS